MLLEKKVTLLQEWVSVVDPSMPLDFNILMAECRRGSQLISSLLLSDTTAASSLAWGSTAARPYDSPQQIVVDLLEYCERRDKCPDLDRLVEFSFFCSLVRCASSHFKVSNAIPLMTCEKLLTVSLIMKRYSVGAFEGITPGEDAFGPEYSSFTLKEVSLLTGLNVQTIRNAASTSYRGKKLKTKKHGKNTVVWGPDLRAWLSHRYPNKHVQPTLRDG